MSENSNWEPSDSRFNWAKEATGAFTACFVTLHMVSSQKNEFCVVLCLVHSSFSSNLMSSLFCVPFVFVFFHPFILFACPLLLLLPVFMHGTWWEELEPPSCHSSRLQFDWNMIMITFITAPNNTLHPLSIRLHISCNTAEAPKQNQDLLLLVPAFPSYQITAGMFLSILKLHH